jgi:hypothetical protein
MRYTVKIGFFASVESSAKTDIVIDEVSLMAKSGESTMVFVSFRLDLRTLILHPCGFPTLQM